jgi:hypothetical protein
MFSFFYDVKMIFNLFSILFMRKCVPVTEENKRFFKEKKNMMTELYNKSWKL